MGASSGLGLDTFVSLTLWFDRKRSSFASPHTIPVRVLHGPVFWGRTEPLVVGRTSSRGQSGPDLVSIYPYPAYGAAGPVGGGPGGRRGAIADPGLLEADRERVRG